MGQDHGHRNHHRAACDDLRPARVPPHDPGPDHGGDQVRDWRETLTIRPDLPSDWSGSHAARGATSAALPPDADMDANLIKARVVWYYYVGGLTQQIGSA